MQQSPCPFVPLWLLAGEGDFFKAQATLCFDSDRPGWMILRRRQEVGSSRARLAVAWLSDANDAGAHLPTRLAMLAIIGSRLVSGFF